VKIACSSTAFDRALQSGELTQLEFLDHAAHEMHADGVVLDGRHFPRSDDDYLAQIKKMAADTGLTITALASDDFFVADEGTMRDQLRIAVAIGAPLLSGRLGAETALTWSEQLERLGTATSLAKKTNVTLAVRNATGTFAATTADCKRVSKETDSAWLRFGIEPNAFDAASDPAVLADRTVLIWAGHSPGDLADVWWPFNGFIALDRANRDASVEETKTAIRAWRTAILQPNRM
jgi:sugar phosphate isomerase/epimerase